MKLLKKIKSWFLGIFGDIKVYKGPLFIVYAPDSFRVKGYHTREAMKKIRPGDVVQRKYVHYIDGFFIPGRYSHSGVYVGKGKVIHAVAEGVCEIDLIDFMRCDGFRILRPVNGQKQAIERARSYLGKPYDFSFKVDEDSIYCHELAAHCYEELDTPLRQPRLFGFTFGAKPCYLAESFDTDDFEVVFEHYPFKK